MTSNMFLNFAGLNNDSQHFDINIKELDENSDKAIHNNPNIKLKPHQLTLLQRCIDYEKKTINLKQFNRLENHVTDEDIFKTKAGIIADRVGSGKSFVILALIYTNSILDQDNTAIKSCGYNNLVFYIKDKKPVVKTNLLVIPHNLCKQWETYTAAYFKDIPDFKFIVLNKNKSIDNLEDITDYDLVIVTTTLYSRIVKVGMEKTIKFQRVIYDEIDNLNLSGYTSLDANFYWLVTASYGNTLYPRGLAKFDSHINRYVWFADGLKNSGYVKTMLLDIHSSIPRELMKVMIVKNSDEYVFSSIQLPEIFSNIILCKTPTSINILNGIVDKNIISCLNAGDVQAALSFVNPTNKNTEDCIITYMVSNLNKQITNLNLRLDMTANIIYSSDREKQNEVASLTKKLEEYTNKIKLIQDRVKSNNICAICYDDIENKTITNCCQNSFCFKCLHIWISKKAICPLCKQGLDPSKIFVVSQDINTIIQTENDDEMIDPNEFHKTFDKFENLNILLKKLKDKTNSKILIFSNYDNTFSKIMPYLIKHGLKSDYIKGNGNTIKCIVERYKGTELDTLLVNTRNYGTGMNLENTTDIIMFHKFDTQFEQQIIGRAHRLGRTDPLNVHYLLYDNEMSV